MTSYINLSGEERIFIAVLSVALITVSVGIAVNMLFNRRQKRYAVPAVLTACLCMLLLQAVGDCEEGIVSGVMSVMGGIAAEMPVGLLAGIMTAAALAEVILFIYVIRPSGKVLSPMAIKESLDLLPDGVCFYDSGGRVILINNKMLGLSGEIFGRSITNGCAFWEDIKDAGVKNGAEVIRFEGNMAVKTADGRVWDFRKNEITVGGEPVTELLAYDATEQYRLTMELKRRNKRLESIGGRLKALSLDIERVIREKEILNAKIKVHDGVGRSLLALRLYIAQNKDKRDRAALVRQFNGIVVGILSCGGRDKGDVPENVIRDARKLGVEVIWNGEIPENALHKALILMAARECASNAARHAAGKRLYITIKSAGGGTAAEFTNDGIKPEGEIKEKGGLKNLRRAVEKTGGIMKVTSEERFSVALEFPREELKWPKQGL